MFLYFLVVSFENHMKILRTIDHWENPISFHIYSTLVNHMVAVKLKHKSFTGSLNTCYSKQIRYMTRAVTPSVSQNDNFPWCSDAELKAASKSAVGFELNWGPCAILASIKRGTVRASDNYNCAAVMCLVHIHTLLYAFKCDTMVIAK